jgi:hypothetical protein
MKKVFLIIGLIAVTGCKKVEPEVSNCGTVVAKGQKLDLQGNVIGYQLGIINELTNNQQSFEVDYLTYLTVEGMDRYCVEGVTTW